MTRFLDAKIVSGFVSCSKEWRKTEAINRFGYQYDNTLSVWSAERDGRVLITLWDRHIRKSARGRLYVDYNELYSPLDLWPSEDPRLAKHKKRAKRLASVLGDPTRLDVVVLFGEVDNTLFAAPWQPSEQGNRMWNCISVDQETGYFRMETEQS